MEEAKKKQIELLKTQDLGIDMSEAMFHPPHADTQSKPDKTENESSIKSSEDRGKQSQAKSLFDLFNSLLI